MAVPEANPLDYLFRIQISRMMTGRQRRAAGEICGYSLNIGFPRSGWAEVRAYAYPL